MAYKLWLMLSQEDEQGRQEILSAIFRMGDTAPLDHPIEFGKDVQGGEQLRLDTKTGAGTKTYVQAGQLVSKPKVTLVASKIQAEASPEDGILVTLTGDVPAETKLRVGNFEAVYDDPEGLLVQWDEPNVLTVEVSDPFVYCDNMLRLQFIEPIQEETQVEPL